MIRMGLITRSRSVFDTLLAQINEVFGELVLVVGYCLDEVSARHLDCDLCLVSFSGIRELAERVTHKKVIVAHRTLNLTQLTPIFELKRDTSVYVVNNFKESTEETIELLETLGLNHLHFFPYYPNSGLPLLTDINVAITPGMSSLVPPHLKTIIDIGNRIIDVSTLIEVGILCNFPLNKAHFITARAVKQIVTLQMKQANLVSSLTKMNRQMQIVLDNISDGVIAADHELNIISCNDISKVLLKIPLDKNLIGKPIYQIIPALSLDSINPTSILEVNKLVNLHSTQILITRTPLSDDSGLNGYIFILKNAHERAKSTVKSLGTHNQGKGYVAKYTFSNLLTKSDSMKRVLHIAQKIALTDLPVLILGESGTGKELLAQAIHNASWRQNQPFLAINLASFPETLLESELFGYEEGAFTGAQKSGKPGLLELAVGGSIFLDEIAEISPHIQVKLLRVLEEKEIMRIGGTKIIPIDVRIIAATNQDIRQMVKVGSFRRDLYYRLCVSPLEIPPLRSRIEDILSLGEHYFTLYQEKKVTLSPQIVEIMMNYDWPGNVRELKEMIRFCTQLTGGEAEGLELFHQTLNRLTMQTTSKPKIQTAEENWEPLLAIFHANELAALLEEMEKAKQQGERIGRIGLQRKIEKRGIYLSQQQVRTRLEGLQNQGFIRSGLGRQGSSITSAGECFLNFLRSLL